MFKIGWTTSSVWWRLWSLVKKIPFKAVRLECCNHLVPEISPRDGVLLSHSEFFHVMRFPALDAHILSHTSALPNVRELFRCTKCKKLIYCQLNSLLHVEAVVSDIMRTDLKDSCLVKVCGTFMNYLGVSQWLGFSRSRIHNLIQLLVHICKAVYQCISISQWCGHRHLVQIEWSQCCLTF